MEFSKASLHPPVFVSPEHQAAVKAALAKIASLRQPARPTPKGMAPPPFYEIPITTISLNMNFDAYINISYQDAPAGQSVSLLLDSGNSMLIVPRWEDIAALPNSAANYQVLGAAKEPWGCPVNVVRGPILLQSSSGDVLTLENCVFYACTGNDPNGNRTANFGAGCITPWSSNGWNTPAGLGVTLQAPLSYNSAYPYVKFNYAAADQIHSAAAAPNIVTISSLNVSQNPPAGYQMFQIIPNTEWMSLVPRSLKIGGTLTQWPGTVNSPIAMIDTGGGPVFLSDPNGYLYQSQWPDPVPNPFWASSSQNCISTSDDITIELGDQNGSFTYAVDTSSFPSSVQGLTLVMCQSNAYMMSRQGMNIGGISALEVGILVDFANFQVGLKPK
jgi:hypothetical protein